MPGPFRLTRRRAAGAIATLATLAGASYAAVAAPAATSPAGEAIVQFLPGTAPAAARIDVMAAGGVVTGELPIIHGLVAHLSASQADELRGDAAVKAVTFNAAVKSTSVSTRRLETSYPLSLSAPNVWNTSSYSYYSTSAGVTRVYTPAQTGRGVGVAVIDTGIAGGLPDFRRSGWDPSSRVIASAVVNPNATTAEDTYGHGTHVAGIIAGNGNMRTDGASGHFIGVAPEANLISVKVADDNGDASVLDVIYGLQFVVDHKADYNIRVVNMSLDSVNPSSAATDPMDAAVEAAWNAGIVVVAAAGNAGDAPDAVSHAPANDPYIITVGATDDQGTPSPADDTVASWSSRGVTSDGVTKPEVLAPGAHIVSTLAPDSAFQEMCPWCVVEDSYIRAGGTSMAAPMVSGMVALMVGRRPSLTPNQVKGILTSTEGGTQTPDGVLANARMAVYAPDVPTANTDLTPNTLLDPATGQVDPTRSSWSRSSWSSAGPDLTAGWARSSWSCDCSLLADGSLDPSRSSWSRSSWSTSWTD
ncbi:MAG: S8 family peptidase [Thermoleophilia bacterium]